MLFRSFQSDWKVIITVWLAGGDDADRKGKARYHEEVENVVAIHEQDLAALRRVELVAQPIARRFGDFASGYDEGVIDENPFANFGIEDLMAEHHAHLVEYLGDIGIGGLADAGGIELSPLRPDAEVEDVLGRKGELHPDVLAIFK